jgi:hypothetical protein
VRRNLYQKYDESRAGKGNQEVSAKRIDLLE